MVNLFMKYITAKFRETRLVFFSNETGKPRNGETEILPAFPVYAPLVQSSALNDAVCEAPASRPLAFRSTTSERGGSNAAKMLSTLRKTAMCSRADFSQL